MSKLSQWWKRGTKPKEKSLNERILTFIENNNGRAIPARETTFLPEILIPCYNHGRYLPRLIRTIAHKNVPITIIDDNSDIETGDTIDRLQTEYGLQVIRNESNLKQSGSLNKAIRQSSNNLFIIANADDFLMPNWIDYAIQQTKETTASMVGGMHLDFLNHFAQSEEILADMVKSIQYQPSAKCRLYGPKDAPTFTHDNSIDMTMSGCTFLKSAWEFVGGFYPLEGRVSIHDDRDFQMRVCAFFDVAVSSEMSAFWRTDSSTGMGTK